mmetsp:Transcript_30726/g.108056  ORF Transcript_30726/g.108056 Transcript_30726/m.108056 type:complete len:225 (+) Transcript_30726:689-1363(+)
MRQHVDRLPVRRRALPRRRLKRCAQGRRRRRRGQGAQVLYARGAGHARGRRQSRRRRRGGYDRRRVEGAVCGAARLFEPRLAQQLRLCKPPQQFICRFGPRRPRPRAKRAGRPGARLRRRAKALRETANRKVGQPETTLEDAARLCRGRRETLGRLHDARRLPARCFRGSQAAARPTSPQPTPARILRRRNRRKSPRLARRRPCGAQAQPFTHVLTNPVLCRAA